jgi:hypothetical protein
METTFGWIKKGVFLAFLMVILSGIPAFAGDDNCGCKDGGSSWCGGISGGSIDTPG